MTGRFRSNTSGIVALALLSGAILTFTGVSRAQNVSVVTGARKVRSKVVPAYPDLARQTHLTGKVRIEATVSADGRVTAAKILGGSPVLVSVATDALNKWRFEAGTSETTETVEFSFSGVN